MTRELIFSEATLSPTEVLAADTVEFVIRLVVGPGYTPGQSRLIFDFPATVGMSRPSRMHVEDDGFLSAYVSNPDVTYTERVWDMEIADFASREKSSWRGRAARMGVLDLSPGLMKGDVIELHWGELAGGYGQGARVTHVVPLPDYEAVMHVRYFESWDEGLPDLGRSYEGYERPAPICEIPLAFRVVPRAPERLRLIRKRDRAMLVPLDRFTNVPLVESASALVDATERPERNRFGVFEFRRNDVQVTSRGLPLRQTARMDDVYDGYHLFWGDVHTHSSISKDCIEREKLQMTPEDLMAFARYRAGLDFLAITDHHQPMDSPRSQIGADRWDATMEALERQHRPGEFVVFPGFEYRCRRGDTVVLCNWVPTYDEIDQPGWTDIRLLWKAWKERDFLTIPHFHNGGRLAEGEWWSPQRAGVEPVLEIFSCHGSYEREDAIEQHIALIKQSRPDRYGLAFLERGYRMGYVCNSDGHKGHVGSNGVTAVFAKELTRDQILEAYRARRVYGTTNAQIRLIFTANGQLMGSVLPNSGAKTFEIKAIGERPLKKVELFRNGALAKRWRPEGTQFQTEWTAADDEPGFWTARVTQLDNHIALSSPIWFEAR